MRKVRLEPGGWGSLHATGRGEECAHCSQLHRRLLQGCSQGRTVVWLPCRRPLYQLLIAMIILHNSHKTSMASNHKCVSQASRGLAALVRPGRASAGVGWGTPKPRLVLKTETEMREGGQANHANIPLADPWKGRGHLRVHVGTDRRIMWLSTRPDRAALPGCHPPRACCACLWQSCLCRHQDSFQQKLPSAMFLTWFLRPKF